MAFVPIGCVEEELVACYVSLVLDVRVRMVMLGLFVWVLLADVSLQFVILVPASTSQRVWIPQWAEGDSSSSTSPLPAKHTGSSRNCGIHPRMLYYVCPEQTPYPAK
jgi:hypothetical protein